MYIVYNIETTRSLFWQSYGGVKLFKTEGSAKAAITREIKKLDKKNDEYEAYKRGEGDQRWMNRPSERINREDYAIAECIEFRNNIEKQEPVANLMNGKVVMESVNTPNFLSVGSETYWSS